MMHIEEATRPSIERGFTSHFSAGGVVFKFRSCLKSSRYDLEQG